MSSLHQERLLKIITSFSPRKSTSPYYPAGSLSSNQHSQETEENQSEKSSNEDFSIEAEKFDKDSLEIITYETAPPTSRGKDKDLQTSFDIDPLGAAEKMKEMTQVINSLQERCKSYEKQNYDLRKEMQQASKEIMENNRNCLRSEVQRLRSRVAMHENMLVRVLKISEELCDEDPDISKKSSVLDVHTYNYIISKLEIARYRMNRYSTRIQQLEYEKSSISEMLNCYITTEKILDTKSKSSSSESVTPELLNPSKFSSTKCSPKYTKHLIEPLFSNKCSILMETHSNYGLKNLDDDNYYRRPSSATSDIPEDGMSKTTINNIKTFNSLSRNATITAKQKSGHSYSVSPLVPKPKKSSKSSGKENQKSNISKIPKANIDDPKKKFNKVYC